ncbi:unnamed protein product [Prorocentrum cordatum]|uniref:Uncharacterized protein n=1 Tax=Prorocentrum cordatum TaxID=2364126 RepID=A0ABN9PK37_9DINO|nr:unnamed protein product [Polarella glacialis]
MGTWKKSASIHGPPLAARTVANHNCRRQISFAWDWFGWNSLEILGPKRPEAIVGQNLLDVVLDPGSRQSQVPGSGFFRTPENRIRTNYHLAGLKFSQENNDFSSERISDGLCSSSPSKLLCWNLRCPLGRSSSEVSSFSCWRCSTDPSGGMLNRTRAQRGN